jgi:hypothetical protein
MRAWLRERRERAERIEDEAGELIRLLGTTRTPRRVGANTRPVPARVPKSGI